MTITQTLVIALVSLAFVGPPTFAQTPHQVPSQTMVEETEEQKNQASEEMEALMEDLFETSDKDNNDALSIDELVDFQFELMILQARKMAPPGTDLSNPEIAEMDIKPQIRESLESEWEELGPDENSEIPKQQFFKSILGEDYKNKEESKTGETSFPKDTESVDSSDKQEPVSNEPRQTDTETR